MRKMPWEFTEAKCRETGVELFFRKEPDDPEIVGFPRDHYKRAVAVCDTCVHKDDCGMWGLEHESHGVWGGMTPNDRERARRKLGIRLIPKVPSTPWR
jgi:hypothetical protein